MPATKTSVREPRESRASIMMVDRKLSWVLSAALALSGVAALVYQVLWVRQLSIVVGVEVYSITLAVSAFFAGLAAGGAVLGRTADRVRSPARLYAALEIAIAVLAVATTIALPYAALPFVWMREHLGVLAWLLPFVLVGVPAFAMGGTVPAALRALRVVGGAAATEGGSLYAANTLGGIIGALSASFALIPWLGLRGSALSAAILNLVAAALVWLHAKQGGDADSLNSTPSPTSKAVTRTQIQNSDRVSRWLPLTLYALAGAIALGYEVVWTQAIVQFVSTRVFAFSIVLATYLAGLAAGAWAGSRMLRGWRDSWAVFALLIAGAGLIAMLEFAALGPWVVNTQFIMGNAALKITGSEAARMYTSFAVAGLGMVFVPTLLLGAAFPMALRLILGARSVGRDVGRVLAMNTAGGILGTLLTGFVLVPVLGLVRTLGMLTIGAVTVGSIAALWSRKLWPRLVVGAMAAAVVAAAFVTPVDRLARLLLATRGGGALVFYDESRGATVAVAQQRAKDNVFRRLYIQGVSNSGDALPSMRYMRLEAMLPLFLHEGEPQSVMVIGFGTGITAGETLRYPGLKRRVCAELLPAVVRSGQLFPENYKAWSDPNLEIRFRDGRQELTRSTDQYDVITLEPPPPSAQGVANLYSREFYELAKHRLAPNGIFAQWLPLTTQNSKETRELVRSFLDAFPYATLWTTEMHETTLVGSMSPIHIKGRNFQERFAPQTVVASLMGVGIDSPAALLATWITDRKGLERFAAGAPPVTDDKPRVEYGSWVRSDEVVDLLPEILALKSDVPVENADSALKAEVQQRRAVLMDFYSAGLAAYAHDQTAWRTAIARVEAAEPENAYYRWVVGRD